MNKQSGFAHLILLLLLVVGLVVAVYLVSQSQIFKSLASTPPIVFKKVDGTALPLNGSGIPQSSSNVVRVDITSTLGPPQSTVSAPVSGPKQTYTVSYTVADNPADLGYGAEHFYYRQPTTFNYAFKDTTPGPKFLWVRFKDSNGKTDDRSAEVDLVGTGPTPTFSPSPLPPISASPSAIPSLPPGPANVGVSPSFIPQNGQIDLVWKAIPTPDLMDHAAIVTQDGSQEVGVHSFWINNGCSWFAPNGGAAQAAGSCTISLASEAIQPGTYKVGIFSGNSRTTGVSLLGYSNTFTIAAPAPTSSPSAQPSTNPVPNPTVQDSFNRVNNSFSLGNADTGQTWQVLKGRFGVNTNQAFISSGCPAPGYAVVDTVATDGDLYVTLAVSTQDARIPFRVTDLNNNFYLERDGVGYHIDRTVNGQKTTIATSNHTPADGDKIHIVLSGSKITVFVNDVQILAVNDSTYTPSATKMGIGTWCDTRMRFDDFSFVPSGFVGVADQGTTTNTGQGVVSNILNFTRSTQTNSGGGAVPQVVAPVVNPILQFLRSLGLVK